MSNTKFNVDNIKAKLNSDEFKSQIERISTVDSLVEFLKSENMEYKTYEYFKMISDIPRNSGKEKEISDFIKKFAEDRGYENYQDEFNNNIVYVPASDGMEDRAPIMIQGHTDMVCVKEGGNVHNFDTDPLKLYTENGMLRADGTTLGGDDGIAVAYMMSIMDDKSIKHPALECVFTSDEEGSFIGAENLDMSKLKAKTLINIDSDDENIMIVSCAGGVAFEDKIKFKREDSKLEKPTCCELKISGLKGGHSGSDIHLGRANSIKLAGEVMEKFANEGIKFEVLSIKSGEAANVIPSKGEIVLLVDEKDLNKLKETTEKIETKIKNDYEKADSKIKIEIKEHYFGVESDEKFGKPIEKEATDKMIKWMKMFKNGVNTMSNDIDGLVESSYNVGTVEILGDEIVLVSECRSCVDEKITEIINDMKKLSQKIGTQNEVLYTYPGWKFNQKSDARKSFNESIEKIYGKKAQELAVHSGLEVGFFVDGVDGIDAISIGPNMIDIHTPEEKLDIISALKIWYALIDFLGK